MSINISIVSAWFGKEKGENLIKLQDNSFVWMESRQTDAPADVLYYMLLYQVKICRWSCQHFPLSHNSTPFIFRLFLLFSSFPITHHFTLHLSHSMNLQPVPCIKIQLFISVWGNSNTTFSNPSQRLFIVLLLRFPLSFGIPTHHFPTLLYALSCLFIMVSCSKDPWFHKSFDLKRVPVPYTHYRE